MQTINQYRGRLIELSVVLLFLCVAAQPAYVEAKSTVWGSGNMSDLLAYTWNSSAAWGLGLQNINVNITRNASMYRNGSLVSDGDVLSVGDSISFSVPVVDQDIAWFATGYSIDSPYGRWINDAGFASITEYVGSYSIYNIYSLLSADPSDITLTYSGSTAGLDCDGDGGADVNPTGYPCVVISQGTILAQVNYSSTYGKFYYRYTGGNDFATQFQTVPMRRISTGFAAASAWSQPVEPSDYILNIPQQTITFSANAASVGNNSPSTPVITGPVSAAYSTSQTFGFTATDPDGDQIRYEIDWTDNGMPYVVNGLAPVSGSYLNSGTQASADYSMPDSGATYTVRARTVDNKGGASAWVTYTTTLITSINTCNGTAPSNATACSTTEPSDPDENYQIVANCGVTPSKCLYTCDSGYYPNTSTSCVATKCNDDEDDDGDGKKDMEDPGCLDKNDDDETDTPPTLTASPRTVTEGSQTTLTWDTNNGNERACTLTGGNIAANPLEANGGDMEMGSVNIPVSARTTYTVTCPTGSASVTVDVIPVGFES